MGRSSGPFVKLNDIWLVYTNSVMTLDQGRVMVPARYFAHVAAMGFYTRGNQAIALRFLGRNLEFEVNSDRVRLDGQAVPSSRLSYVREGRVMIPLETVTRAFGLDMRWDAQRKLLFLSGSGLASQEAFHGDALGPYAQDPLFPLFLSTRTHLVDRYIGITTFLPEVPDIVPTTFLWAWRQIPTREYPLRQFLNLSMDQGFKVKLVREKQIHIDANVVLGYGVDNQSELLGYFVTGAGRYFHYYADFIGPRESNNRDYCYPLGYDPDCHVEVRTMWGNTFRVPRFVFLRIYTW